MSPVKLLICAVGIAIFSAVCNATSLRFEQPEVAGVHWAIIVAGSNGWDNYRHQVYVLKSCSPKSLQSRIIWLLQSCFTLTLGQQSFVKYSVHKICWNCLLLDVLACMPLAIPFQSNKRRRVVTLDCLRICIMLDQHVRKRFLSAISYMGVLRHQKCTLAQGTSISPGQWSILPAKKSDDLFEHL